MIRSFFLYFISLFFAINGQGQVQYRAEIKRADGFHIAFNIAEDFINGKRKWAIKNADEQIPVNNFLQRADSLFVEMPFFEAEMRLKKTSVGYEGQWKKVGSKGDIYMPLIIEKGTSRIKLGSLKPVQNITGRWKTLFTNQEGKSSSAIAEFKQSGNTLYGTFLTTTGDYRFLEGSIAGDTLALSGFDGTHAFFFSARIDKSGSLVKGVFASGATSMENWSAERDAVAELDGSDARMYVRGVDSVLNFQFPDLDSNLVSLQDERFKNKVVVIQIMGSWCPNCMDETAFLSEYYRQNRLKGVEMIGLAYEYSLDFSKASKSLSRFRDRFKVEYPMLITGVTSSDTLRTEKTLPEMTNIKAFPSMIILGKDGKVKSTHAGYEGPATGVHHEKFKREFNETIEQLLKQY
jgi:thiol-disulfide isomerase/thioredoxin